MTKTASIPDCGDFQEISPRPTFSNYCRNLPPDIVHWAVFVVPIRLAETNDEADEKFAVAGCEGASCTMRDGGAP